MKSFYTLSLITTAFLFSLTSVHANQSHFADAAPGLPTTPEECFEMLGSSFDPDFKKLCHALAKCEREESQNIGELEDCVQLAQGDYEQETNPFAKNGGEAFQGETIPVKTRESSANYQLKGPDHKGFYNSVQ
jgi:hypothetical protein